MKRKPAMLLCAAALLSILLILETNCLVVTRFEYKSPKLPAEFDGFKIVQISDLHNKSFGENQEQLLGKIRELSPDIIVVTGDLIDRRFMNLGAAMRFVRGAVSIAPVYYVTGNHEAWSGKYGEIKRELTGAGVHMADDNVITLIRNGSAIKILGLSDPAFLTAEHENRTDTSKLERSIAELSDGSLFQVLLSHRPELIDIYAAHGIDLVFSGHAHGGQIRLPFIGALFAPGQGLFPKYSKGMYTLGGTTMIVSGGLGGSVPVRTFNKPEIVAVTLSRAE